MSIIQEARQRAEGILEGNFTSRGLVASRDWYKEVFARDSAISFIGAGLLGKKKYFTALKQTITSLADGQTEVGMVPTCVVAETGVSNFGTIDSTAWLIHLAYQHYYHTGQLSLLKKVYPKLVLAVQCLRANGRGPDDCVWSQESDDWNDFWANHGQTLFVNVVYQAALKYMAILALELNKKADAGAFAQSYRNVHKRIDFALWVPESSKKIDLKDTRSQQIHQPSQEPLLNFAKSRGKMPYYLAFAARGFTGCFCDVISNAMAICFGQADRRKTNEILDYFYRAGVDEPYPAKVIYPPVQEGSEHWRDYYYGFALNLPNHYHNGGAWPHCGGFYVAAHIKAGRMAEARRQLEKLAEFNAIGLKGKGQWEFVEWAHGENGRASGSKFMSWSAGMYVFAYEALKNPGLLELLDPKLPKISG